MYSVENERDAIGDFDTDRSENQAAAIAREREWLAREIGPGLDGPSASPGGGPTSVGGPSSEEPATLAALLAAEKDGAAAARVACLRAPSYRAALLGSIAAARASHVEVLS